VRVLRALCLIAALIAGAAQAGVAQAATLSGLVLVASEDMPDPRFQETVIYLVNHNENGAFGLIVNKPQGRGPLAALLDELGIELDGAYEDERPTGSITLHYGGPVSPEKGFVLHSADYTVDSTLVLPGGFALTETAEVLRDIALAQGPRQSLLLFGYSGWGPSQLEGEIARGDWGIVDADPDLVLGTDHQSKWERARSGGIVI